MAPLQASDFTPTPNTSTGFSASDFTPADAQTGEKKPGIVANYTDPSGYADDINKLSGTGVNTMNRLNELDNTRAETPDQYAARMKQEKVFGSRTALTADNFYLGGTVPSAMGIANAVPNAILGLANTAKNVGSFAWNTTFHPVDTATNIMADPVGFAEGLIGEPLKNAVSGFASAFVDTFKGDIKGAGKDLQQSLQKAWIGFLDDPVTAIIQIKFAAKIADAPIETTKGIVNDFKDTATKPLQALKSIKDNGVADTANKFVQPIADSVKSTLDGVKTTLSMFSKDGRSKIAGAQANDLFNLSKSYFDVQNYQEKLKNMDISSAEAESLQTKMSQAQTDLKQSQDNLNNMSYKILNFTKSIYDSNSYKTPGDFSNSFGNAFDTRSTEKDARYQQALNKPDGTPVQIDDVSSLVQSLRDKATVLAQKGQGKGATDATNNFADALELRQDINKDGGAQQYIDAEVSRRLGEDKTFGNATVPQEAQDVLRNKIKNEVQQELATKIGKSGQPTDFFSAPLSAHDLQQSMSTFFDNKVPDSDKSLGFFLNSDQYGKSVKGSVDDIMKSNLERDNPDGYNYKKQADAKNTQLDQLSSLFKDKNGNIRTFANIQEAIDFATAHWKDIQKVPELVTPLQNTIASKIYADAIKSDTGTIDYSVIKSGLKTYGDYLRPDQTQALREASLYPKLGEVSINDPKMSDSMKEMVGMNADVQNKENSITDLQNSLKQVDYNKDVVGTDPETIVRNIEGMNSEKTFNNFMDKSGIKDPLEVGKLYKQSVFENNLNADGNMTPEGLISTFDTLMKFGDKSKTYSNELQNQILGPGEQAKYQTMKDTAQYALDLLKTIDKSQTGALSTVKLVYSGMMAYMGFHLSAARMAFSALQSGLPEKGTATYDEKTVRDMITKQVPQAQRGWFTKAILPAQATAEAKKTTDKIDAYLKSAEGIMGHPLSTEERQALMEQYMSAGGSQ